MPARQTTPRDAALAVLTTLQEAGHTAYFAGGCVRDRLLGFDPKDYDIATSARPDDVATIFPRVQRVGEAFGVMLVRQSGQTVEVATFRSDGAYIDGRRPEGVTFSDAEHDAQRRDFTINGMFEDPIADEIIDYVDGQRDLADQVVRAIGDPMQRFAEDHLRTLRAVRFAARFGFALESDTADAIRAVRQELAGVSRERVGHELRMMFSTSNRAVAAWELQYLGLDEPTLNEPNCVVAPTRLGRLPDQVEFPTALAAWALDRHEAVLTSGEAVQSLVTRWTDALILSNVEQANLDAVLQMTGWLRLYWDSAGVARQKRIAVRPDFHEAMLILQTIDRPRFVELRRRVAHLAETILDPDPLISGDDLIAAGFRPGPMFAALLDAVYDAQLEGTIDTAEQAIALARQLRELGGEQP